MDQARFGRIRLLVEQALELDDAERASFLDRECAGDPELRAEVERLLAHPTGSDEFERLRRRIDQAREAHRLPGATVAAADGWIGPYRLLRKIGEGGMGEVWVAEQAEPLKRRVAVKVIKRGMDSDAVIARFEAERQALALMDHPAIARVFDAGQTSEGRPYFVMEYIDGVPITEHCDRHILSMRERLELFVQVCEGVQHAHHKAVIHRDLKPPNVLVMVRGDRAQPKIIDFGVAKATAQRLTEKTVYTELGVLIGTPAYMSPEQAEMTGQNVDTRTDVYALGVLLYELITGVLPFDPRDLRAAGFDEIRRWIREVDPPRPSMRLASLPGDSSTVSARNRGTAPSSLVRQLRRDLDWITMRALEKDRTRRYGSPNDLALDVGRFLRDEPVLAGPPSGAYRAKKYIKRHAWGVAGAAAAVIVLIAFAVTMAIQAARIANERDLARQAQADLEAVAAFQAGMVSATDPETMGRTLMESLAERIAEVLRRRGSSEKQIASTLAAHEALVEDVNATDLALDLVDEAILAAAVQALEEQFVDRPLIDARLRKTIGETYQALGRYERAEPQLAGSVEIRRRILGEDHPDTLDSTNALARLFVSQGRRDEAEPLLLDALEARKRVQGDDDPRTLDSTNSLAVLYLSQARYDEAESLFVENLRAQKRVLGAEDLRTVKTANNLGVLYLKQRRHDEAEPLLLEALRARRRVLGNDHPDTLVSMHNLALAYRNQGRLDEAAALLVDALAARRRANGSDHPETLRCMYSLAFVYENLGRYDDAERLYLESLDGKIRVLGEDHPNTLRSLHNLALLYQKQGRIDEAERLYLKAVEAKRRELGHDHPSTLTSMHNLANVYHLQDRYDDAERLYLQTIEARERVLGHEHRDTLVSMHDLAGLYQLQGRHDEAERWLERARGQ